MVERARAVSDGDGAVPVRAPHAERGWRRHLAVAAALTLLVGGVVAVAIGMSRSDGDGGVIAPAPSDLASTTEPISPTTVPSTTSARTRIAVDESVPTHLASALRAVPIESAREFLARRPLVLPGPEHLPRPEDADDLEYAEATDLGDSALSTSIDYFRWTEAGPVSAMWFGLNATYDAALPAIPGDVMAQVAFGEGVAYVSGDLTAECDQDPIDALHPTALLWQHEGAVHQLEIQPIPECSDTFTWADVRAIVGALLTCWESDGVALCAPADLPPLPEDPPVTSHPRRAPPSDVFVTTSGDHRAVLDIRSTGGVVRTVDLTCPADVDCVVQSARVMGDSVWVAIAESVPDDDGAVVGSRVVSIAVSTGEVDVHFADSGSSAVRWAELGADGVLYAYVDTPDEGRLIAIEDGEERTLETGVAGMRLSDDGRFLAVSFANPQLGETARFEVTDLVERTNATFQTQHVNAGPAAWSPDGRYLIIDEQWEDRMAWVVDPWSGSGDPIIEPILDGACFVDERTLAHRTWYVGYGQGDANPGLIRLTSLDTGATVADVGDELYGDAFRCHPDGSFTYLRRPVIEVQHSPDFSQPEPDWDAPVDLVHIAPDGTITVVASGDLRML